MRLFLLPYLITSGALLQAAATPVTYTVAKDGTGQYPTVQSALDAIPPGGAPATLQIKPGTYYEKITVQKPFVTLRGSGDGVILTYDLDHARANGTSASASTTIASPAHDFAAERITFQNTATLGKPLGEGSQAVALAVKADRAIFRRCRFLGFQDTLLADRQSCPSPDSCLTAREYFVDCYIEGNVDFIFGAGKTVFENCHIHVLPNSRGKTSWITAQSKVYPAEDSGYVFEKCRITVAEGNTDQIWLGRPWRPYSTVVYLDTALPAAIQAAGWREWTPPTTHSLETATYAEYHSTGAGANPAKRDPHSRQLTEKEAQAYRPAVFLAGADHWTFGETTP